jgi:hypothetical protein
MQSTPFRIGILGAVVILLAAGCDSSGSGQSGLEGGWTEAGKPPDALDAAKDVPAPGADAPDVRVAGDGLAADGRDVAAALDGPGGGPAVEPAVDGGAIEPSPDAPLGGATEAGPATGIDGSVGEAGGLPPLVYPDGGLSCGLAGAVCQSAADCCGLACIANRCAAAACRSDGMDCAAGGECCSTMCGTDGKCRPLNTACKTAGNACATGAECCSGLCNASKQCAQPGQVSYCAQTGDICRGDSECCTGVCKVEPGAAAGTCATIAMARNCQINGTVCTGCGGCCSHFCGPFGVGGPSICQPASGCHVEGDLCHADADCCGGDLSSGMHGAGLVRCAPDPVYGGRIGTCGNPKASNCPDGADTCKNTCIPDGNVCHFKPTPVCGGDLTNVNNNCCDCVNDKGCCQIDATGIPRCNSLTGCVPAGGSCAFSSQCCNRLPCVPDPVTGRLACGSTCVPMGGACTTNADCCTGMLCEATPGSLAGVCLIPTPPVVVPDGGAVVPDAEVPEPDASIPAPDAPPPVCAYYGQACSPTIPCCGGISCVNQDFGDCTATDVGCVCFTPE